jgi:hypothetical protein
MKETDNTVLLPTNIFEEWAEHLSKQELNEWSVETSQDQNIIKKLQGTGAQLLIGPRGSGKSTLLRKAYFNLLDAGEILPAYINYSKSLALEPLFHNHANALQIFRQWVLFKIVAGIAETFEEAQKAMPENLAQYAQIAVDFIHELERGNEPNLENAIAPSALKHLIDGWASDNGFRRCVLLLDDAAHAFSSMQQKEFFEIFRSLKSRTISPKAAVYPGITSYSPNFHLGHDVKLIEAWYKPEEEGYLGTMRELIKKRLPQKQVDDLLKEQELVDYLAVASFGVPRNFLTMISQILGIEEDSPNELRRSLAKQAINENCSVIRGIFQSLSGKLPQYSHFIEMGRALEKAIIKELKKYNKASIKQKTVIVGIADPIEPELDKILALLEYAGIVRSIDSISWDNNQSYRRYSVHYALLIEKNALSLGRNYPLSMYITTLTKRELQNFLQRSGTRLLGNDFQTKCILDLAPCQNCGAPRAYEEAKFCVECGEQLSTVSIYEELLKGSIDKLPLPNKKIAQLKKHSSIKTVQDILIDDENQKIRKIKGIGPVWASRIRNAAEEFVSV